MYKICLIAHLNDLSGANKSLVDLADGLSAHFDVTVIVPRKGPLSETLTERNIKWHEIYSGTWVYKTHEKWYKRQFKQLVNQIAEKKFYQYFKTNKFDLVHYNSSVYGCGARSLLELGMTYTWHIRELPESNFSLTFFNREISFDCIKRSTQIITISDFMKDKIKKSLGVDNVITVYNGVKVNTVQAAEGNDSQKDFVIIGAVAKDKGQLDAIRAIKILHRKGLKSKLFIVGPVTDEDYDKRIKEEIDDETSKYIIFTGYQKNVSQYRTSKYVALVCSPAEAFGRVTIEAMNAGQLTIGARGGATPEIIDDGRNGYLYTPGNSDELANCMQKSIENDNACLIENAKRTVEQQFDIKSTVENVSAIFLQVITDREGNY